jgi:hypothetical protein
MNDPETILIFKEASRRLMRALHLLPLREEKIIRERFGLDGEPKTLKQLAEEEGCCRERIRQLEKIGLRRLKGMAAVRKLAQEQNLIREYNPNLYYSPPSPHVEKPSVEILPPPRKPSPPPPKYRWFDVADPFTWLDKQALDEQIDAPYHPPRPYIVMAFTTQDGHVVPSREFFATEEQAIEAIARNAGYPIIFCSFAFCVADGWRFVTKYGSLPESYVETTYIYPSIRDWAAV